MNDLIVTTERSTNNKVLVKVRWEQETPDADAPTLEAVFEGFILPGSFLTDDDSPAPPAVLILLSVTRVDTREPVILTSDERSEVATVAADKLASMPSRG
jgi:hypothetical protein